MACLNKNLYVLTDHGVVEEEDALVALDEAHAPHVRRQIVHLLAARRRPYAVGQAAEVGVREHAAKLLRVIDLRVQAHVHVLVVGGWVWVCQIKEKARKNLCDLDRKGVQS